jgi:CheY-like chemotaxis protein
MNLAVNARDAMPNGGELTFETANIFIDADMARLMSEAHTGPYVLLTVTDNGSGMSQETMSHMFEPFFTTKSLGKGTGLGLSVVHGIVKQHEGFIICESEQGHGTKFNIYFPAIDSDVEIEEPETQVLALGGLETVLLVDDDNVVRDLCQRILENANYKVIIAADGQEALELYNQRKDEISLVLLDLIMPVMGGDRCLGELLALNPSLKVVIISGYHGETTANDLISAGAKAAIYKPFGPHEVLKVVRNVLGQQS